MGNVDGSVKKKNKSIKRRSKIVDKPYVTLTDEEKNLTDIESRNDRSRDRSSIDPQQRHYTTEATPNRLEKRRII